jgi:glycosyltransferase involved in cell wall biosynthesis
MMEQALKPVVPAPAVAPATELSAAKANGRPVSMFVWNPFTNDARVLKEAQTLQAAGYSVTVFALQQAGVPVTETLPEGITVVRRRNNPFARQVDTAERPRGRVRRFGKLKLLGMILSRLVSHAGFAIAIAGSRADVVHAHDVNTLPTAWLAARLSGAKLVYDAHEISTSREGYDGIRGFIAWIERTFMTRADATITTTEARAKFFARSYDVDRPLVLQNRPRWAPSSRSSLLRDRLGLKEPWPIVLYQGGLQQGRGLERLVDTSAAIEGAYYVFVGGGRIEEELRARAAALPSRDRVFFIPTVSLAELPRVTESADIGVQPLENTCFNHFSTDSNKLFEYVAAGLPVVATDLPEVRRVVAGYDLGLLVRSGDTDGLARAIRRLVEDNAARETFRRKAMIAAATLTWEAQEASLVELYRRLAPTSA